MSRAAETLSTEDMARLFEEADQALKVGAAAVMEREGEFMAFTFVNGLLQSSLAVLVGVSGEAMARKCLDVFLANAVAKNVPAEESPHA